jgi:hypothetical protein
MAAHKTMHKLAPLQYKSPNNKHLPRLLFGDPIQKAAFLLMVCFFHQQ